MPHLRTRHLQPLLAKTMSFSPIVGVFGHRQVGKTTLCEKVAGRYISLDRKEFLLSATNSPTSLIRENQGTPLVLDECQLAPPLFPALKEWVRENKKPGQFLLTGSVRFSSRKAIRESLTGRIINWELLPMDLSESHSAPLPEAIPKLLDLKKFEQPIKFPHYFSMKNFETALKNGGLPGVFAIRDDVVKKQRFETQIETLLERDLRLIVETSLEFRVLRNLLSVLALKQGEPLEFSEISRASRISVPALKRVLFGLESAFIIRTIETEGSRRRPVLFFEDQGEATHLAGEPMNPLLNMTRFLFSFVRQQWVYRPTLNARLFQYRNRGGAFVPLAIKTEISTLGFIPMIDETPGKHELGSAESFIDSFPNARCVFLHLGKTEQILGKNLRVLPLGCLT